MKVYFLFYIFGLAGVGIAVAFSPLQKIVASQAVFYTVISRMEQEIFSENILLQQLTIPHSNLEYLRASHGIGSTIYCAQCFMTSFGADIFYLLIIGASIYARYSFDPSEKINKLWSVSTLSSIQRWTRFLLLVFLFVFTKNVNNAI
jgi:hypothetical protein